MAKAFTAAWFSAPSRHSKALPFPPVGRCPVPCRSRANASSIKRKRRSNLALASADGCLRIGWYMAGEICDGEQKIADFLQPCAAASPESSAASISSVSSRIFSMTRRGSFQSKPTVEALACNFTARVKPGRARGISARRLSPGLALCFADFSSCLIFSQSALISSGCQIQAGAEDMRMAPDHFLRDCLHHRTKIEEIALFGDAGLKNNLQGGDRQAPPSNCPCRRVQRRQPSHRIPRS